MYYNHSTRIHYSKQIFHPELKSKRQPPSHSITLQHTATQCNVCVFLYTAASFSSSLSPESSSLVLKSSGTSKKLESHSITLQHTATQCNVCVFLYTAASFSSSLCSESSSLVWKSSGTSKNVESLKSNFRSRTVIFLATSPATCV